MVAPVATCLVSSSISGDHANASALRLRSVTGGPIAAYPFAMRSRLDTCSSVIASPLVAASAGAALLGLGPAARATGSGWHGEPPHTARRERPGDQRSLEVVPAARRA